MLKRIIIPITGDDVAPRFDLATEVQIVTISNEGIEESNTVVLPQASAEKLCHMIVADNAKIVICGGIEDEFYQYLIWKRVQVFDSVIGPWKQSLARYLNDSLSPGDILVQF